MSPEELNVHMQTIYKPFRYRWCKGGWCACMGCANVSGELFKLGVTEEEWQEWVKTHPEKE